MRAMFALQSELEAQAADLATGAALRQMKQFMKRLQKGEAAMRVEIWREKMKMDAYRKHRELQAALEAQMVAQAQGAGIRILRQVMKRLEKGEKGLRVEIWRAAMQDEARTSTMARVQSELEAQAADLATGAALRQMKQFMKRLQKGEAAMRVEIWRANKTIDVYAKHREIQMRLEVQMRGTCLLYTSPSPRD